MTVGSQGGLPGGGRTQAGIWRIGSTWGTFSRLGEKAGASGGSSGYTEGSGVPSSTRGA